jgi:drug/metabolite transporter (DMT)-like permease
VLLGVFFYADSLVGLKRIADQSHPLATTAGALVVASPLFLIAWFLKGALLPQDWSGRGLGSIFYLGIFGSVLGFALYYLVFRKMESASVVMITVVTPILALFTGKTFNEEKLPALVWGGALMICVGLAIHQISTTRARARIVLS